MAIREYSAAELSRSPRDVQLAAEQGPVIITQHRKARYVLMTVAEYEQLTARASDRRRATRVADLEDTDRSALLDALDRQVSALGTEDD